MSKRSVCWGCGTLIKWLKTKKGKAMPVELSEKVIVTEAGEVVRGYESHFATCPEADRFRRGRGGP